MQKNNELILGFLIAVVSTSLLAMDVPDLDQQLLNLMAEGRLDDAHKLLFEEIGSFSPEALDAALWHAAMERNIALSKFLLEKGANVYVLDNPTSNTWPLRIAVEARDLNMIRFLVELGVNLNISTENRGLTVLMFAQNCETVEAILTSLPSEERKLILQAKNAAILAHNLASRKGIIMPIKDIRKIITNDFVNILVDQQIQRIEDLLNVENLDGHVAYEDPGLLNDDDRECLNPYNPKTIAHLRRILEANIRKILFS